MKVLLALITLSWLMKFSESADVNGGTGILAYFLKPNCPTNWQDLSYDASYQGRTIKGWSSTSAVGGTSGNAQVGNNVNSHVHPSWSRRMYFGDSKRTSCLGDCGAKMVDDGADFYMNQGNSNMEWKNGNIAGTFTMFKLETAFYELTFFKQPIFDRCCLETVQVLSGSNIQYSSWYGSLLSSFCC